MDLDVFCFCCNQGTGNQVIRETGFNGDNDDQHVDVGGKEL